MTELRILNLIVWGAMFLYMAPGAVSAVTRHARYGDPMRLACALTAIVFTGFNAFWLWGAGHHCPPVEEDRILNGLLVLSSALGIYIWKLGATYGRGVHLHRERGGA